MKQREKVKPTVLAKKPVRQFKTRTIDLSNSIAVKIDRKTTVYVKQGTDIEKIKRLFKRAS